MANNNILDLNNNNSNFLIIFVCKIKTLTLIYNRNYSSAQINNTLNKIRRFRNGNDISHSYYFLDFSYRQSKNFFTYSKTN